MSALTETDIAEACHELNRIWCRAHGDDSQPSWLDAPDWQHQIVIMGVRKILIGEVTNPADSHAGWLQLKTDDGWVYGPEKDVSNKIHPCMVPYEELPPEQKAKDTLFFNTVKTMMGANAIGN